MCRVNCIGHICADVLVHPVDRLPPPGRLEPVEGISLSLGGCAANAAVVLAKLGVEVGLGAKAGNDALGMMLERELAACGVDTGLFRLADGETTSASVVTVASDGERTVWHCFGTNATFRAEDLPPSPAAGADIVFFAGTFLLPSFEGEALAGFLRRCREQRALVCLDTAWDASGRWLDCLEGVLPELDWFMPSYEEARAMARRDEPAEIAAWCREQGARNVVVKLGAGGCLLAPAGMEAVAVPAVAAAPVVDTSGAGDAFCAGFIAALAAGGDPLECARRGNAAAACCIGAVGTTAGVTGPEEVWKMYALEYGS